MRILRTFWVGIRQLCFSFVPSMMVSIEAIANAKHWLFDLCLFDFIRIAINQRCNQKWCSMGLLRMSGENIVYMNTQFSVKNSMVRIVAMRKLKKPRYDARLPSSQPPPPPQSIEMINVGVFQPHAYALHCRTDLILLVTKNPHGINLSHECGNRDTAPMNARMFKATLNEDEEDA